MLSHRGYAGDGTPLGRPEYDEDRDGRLWQSGYWVAADLPPYNPDDDEAEALALAAVDAERPADPDTCRDQGRRECSAWLGRLSDYSHPDIWLWTGLTEAEAAAMAQRLRAAGCRVLDGGTDLGGPCRPSCSPTWHDVVRASTMREALGHFVGVQEVVGGRPLILFNAPCCNTTVSREINDEEAAMVRRHGNAQQKAAVGAP